MTDTDFDIGIIGGGPGGSSLASYLAQGGLSCIVLEQEHFPRFHVGEAFVPASNRVFQDLGLMEKVNQLFRKKYGSAWASQWFGPLYTRFAERVQPGVDHSYTFHVDRAKFDLLLLQHARESGATVLEGARVRRVDFSEEKQPRIDYSVDGQEKSVSVRLAVDASGRKTLLGNQLKLRIQDEVFDQYAIHTWFEGYDRSSLANDPDTYEDDFTFIYFLPTANSWIWQIPITDSITSVGVVTQKANFAKKRKEREEFFWDCVGSSPQLAASLRTATRIRPFTDEGDYSYAMRQICGDNFLLVGDAARFVDPIFSTGVGIALNSARFASADILRAAEKNDFSKSSFKTYEDTIRRGTQNWYDLISLYYRLNTVFADFVQDERYRSDLIKLLQGDVYDEDTPAVLELMRQYVHSVEEDKQNYKHNWLGDLTAHAFSPTF
jgi:flavin-dependent dehydrogenase